MRRFNYLGAARLKFPALTTTVAIDNRIRGPLAALLTTLILTGAISFVQLTRLHAAQRGYAAISARLVADTAAVGAIRQLQARVDAQARLAAHVAQIQRMSVVHVNELAWIGNHLPPDTWLNALRYENGNYALDGTSDRIAAVGSAMLALHARGGAGQARLVSLRDDVGGGNRHVHYTLRLETRP